MILLVIMSHNGDSEMANVPARQGFDRTEKDPMYYPGKNEIGLCFP